MNLQGKDMRKNLPFQPTLQDFLFEKPVLLYFVKGFSVFMVTHKIPSLVTMKKIFINHIDLILMKGFSLGDGMSSKGHKMEQGLSLVLLWEWLKQMEKTRFGSKTSW